ncbi:MAG: transglutaminase family protein [Armatimonadota bacterium]|nr:transglutaminase family protein [Armatimonadota bacterium]
MTTELQTSSTSRLPWTATVASLIAFAALYVSASVNGALLLLPVLGLALVASHFTAARFDSQSRLVWMYRVIVVGIIIFSTMGRLSGTMLDVIEIIVVRVFGQLCAAELVLQAWLRRPAAGRPGGGSGAVVVLLSCLVFLAASNTFDPRYIRQFTPVYFLFLVLSLPAFRPRPRPWRGPGRWRLRASGTLAVVLAVGLGAATHYAVWRFRFEINQWGSQFLAVRPRWEATGLPTRPRLGPAFNRRGTLNRMLRIENFSGEAHLRALAFDSYSHGYWGPLADERRFEPIIAAQLRPPAAASGGKSMRIDRLEDDEGMIFAPLNCAGLIPPPQTEMEWAPHDGGPLHSVAPAPYPFVYDVYLSADEDHQGPLCIPLSAAERGRYLVVPPEIQPEVRTLARRIGGRLAEPRQRVRAVEDYLLSHHAYSRTINPGPGDPVSNFLLQRKDAHCAYFAAAAVMLLRCLDVPARYVIGYYAHEPAVGGGLVVRQRDAHAWVETWIDGAGWITVDATPPDGRPDEIAERNPAPLWQKIREWIQDVAMIIRRAFSALSQSQQRLVLATGFLITLLFIAWRAFPARHGTAEQSFAYLAPDADLAALAARFEALLQRQGLPCPIHRPWQEHLAVMANRDGQESPAWNPTDALAFVNGYNSIRFGHAEDQESLLQLHKLLTKMEQEPRRTSNSMKDGIKVREEA